MNSICPQINPQAPEVRVWIAVLVKNEAQSLLEWLVWHFLLGVEHVLVYDNDSNDNLKKSLEPFESAGLVHIVKILGVGVQAESYSDAIIRARNANATWLAAIDVDEYIVPILDKCIPNFLYRYQNDSHIAGIRLNWHFATSLGRLSRFENGIVDDSFVIDRTGFYSGKSDPHVKTIVKVAYTSKFIDPHYAMHVNKTYSVSPDSRKVGTYHFSSPPEVKTAVLLHVHVRTLEEWIMKRHRGFADRKTSFCPYCNASLEILTAEWQCLNQRGLDLSTKSHKCKDNSKYVPFFKAVANFEWPNYLELSQIMERQSIMMHSVIMMPILSTGSNQIDSYSVSMSYHKNRSISALHIDATPIIPSRSKVPEVGRLQHFSTLLSIKVISFVLIVFILIIAFIL